MKRIAMSLVAAAALAFGFGGLFARAAEAHGPHHVHRHHHHPHVQHSHGHHHHHRVYRAYPSCTVGYPQYAPYGAGYSAGYYPYSGITIQQPRFGLHIGF